ncbi:MAG: septum formation inhibitor Maf [Clostridiales bacterium]|nr:septum formation inhibitor Maf [Clostridiales bacterium]
MKIILASASPRRKELLEKAGIEFETVVPETDETVTGSLNAEEAVVTIAKRKAQTVAAEYPGRLVLAADTVVALDGEILGKPLNKAQAAEMLRHLSGKTHSVYTGVCIAENREIRSFTQMTRVKFYDLTQDEIDAYVRTGEPIDKAGAYGIQGRGCLLVESIEGDYFNVVGLPVARVVRALKGRYKL